MKKFSKLVSKIVKNLKKGFTLLEILLVVGIIAVLSAIVILAINPNKMLASARNTQRSSDLREINSALIQYYIDHNSYPASTTLLTSMAEICDTGSIPSTATSTNGTPCGADLVNLSDLVPTYLVSIPVDPRATSTVNTPPATPVRSGYKIIITANNRPALQAVLAEQTVIIELGNVDHCDHVATDPDCWSTKSPSDLAWSTEYVNTGIQSDTDGAGNNAALVAIAGNNYPAAEYCDGLDQGGHQDWYLPSKDELLAGYNAPAMSGGFPSSSYWSSTEYSDLPDGYAWYLYTYFGSMSFTNKGSTDSVRCLR